MRLIRARVINFKSIEDSGHFELGQLTAFAGKNESGKTALLQALRKVNPVEKTGQSFNRTMEFPRQRVGEYDEEDPPIVVETVWELDDLDRSAVNEVIGGSLLSKTVTVSTKYSGRATWNVQVDELKALNHLVAQCNELAEEPKARLLGLKNTRLVKRAIEDQGEEATAGEKQLFELLTKWRDGSPGVAAVDVLTGRMPKFLYFSTYSLLDGRVSLEQYKQRLSDDRLTESDKVFESLLELASTSVDEIESTQLSEELIAKLESVSNSLSRDIFKYWTQNRDLKVDFRFRNGLPKDDTPFNSGSVFETRIENTRHRVTVRFDERSTGFVWFFSFLVWFSQMKRNFGNRLIILLDEPGLTLHGTAQGDLLRYIHEKLLPDHQVIYTTHSPFMIDANDLSTVRTVEDVVLEEGTILGTKVSGDVLSTDADTLFPLRAALGYGLTQSLFVGEHSLLVEGPSDLLYLQWASRELRKRGREALSDRWTITPVGGLGKIPSFVALFGGNGLKIAVVADYHAGAKKEIDRIRELAILDGSRVITLDSVTGGSEADIEDILGSELYGALVNRCYSLEGEQVVKLAQDSAPVVKAVEDHFRLLPPEVPEFDHYEPAAHLIENFKELEPQLPGLDEALDRFEVLFQKVNALLP